ncbi:MAG: hypothetical protein LBG43_05845 [Treponema sp.]|nr:hypothetical protein [Treponema sp.]
MPFLISFSPGWNVRRIKRTGNTGWLLISPNLTFSSGVATAYTPDAPRNGYRGLDFRLFSFSGHKPLAG